MILSVSKIPTRIPNFHFHQLKPVSHSLRHSSSVPFFAKSSLAMCETASGGMAFLHGCPGLPLNYRSANALGLFDLILVWTLTPEWALGTAATSAQAIRRDSSPIREPSSRRHGGASCPSRVLSPPSSPPSSAPDHLCLRRITSLLTTTLLIE